MTRPTDNRLASLADELAASSKLYEGMTDEEIASHLNAPIINEKPMTNISKERLDELERHASVEGGSDFIFVRKHEAKHFISAARRLAEVEAERTEFRNLAMKERDEKLRIKAERDEWKARCMDTDAIINNLTAERDELRVLDEESTAKITELVRNGVEAEAKLSNIRWTLGVDEVDERPTVYFVEQLKAERDALKDEVERLKRTVVER